MDISPNNSSLYRWAKSNKDVMTGVDWDGSQIERSHNSICGKIKSMSVSAPKLTAFYSIAARFWHEPTFLSENVLEGVHRLAFDLDVYLEQHAEWTEELASQTGTFFADEVAKISADAAQSTKRVILTGTEPTVVEKQGQENKLKVGMHIYFCDTFVSGETHNNLRNYLLIRLRSAWADRIGHPGGPVLTNGWSNALDENLRALRLVCSSKAAKCSCSPEEQKRKQCKKKKHRVNVGRRYRVLAVFGFDPSTQTVRAIDQLTSRYKDVGDDETQPVVAGSSMHKRRLELIKLTSLRVPPPEGLPGETRLALPEDLDAQLDEADLGDDVPEDGEGLDNDMGVDPYAEECIRHFVYSMGLVADLAEIDTVTASGRGKRPSVYRVSLHNHYCYNLLEDHSSNRTYLLIKSGIKIMHRCFNTSDRLGKSCMPCKRYQTPFYTRNEALSELLFGSSMPPSNDPVKRITNDEDACPMTQFFIDFLDDMHKECSR
jgi:hypothetical protein